MIAPAAFFSQGNVGVVSRSGTLTYQSGTLTYQIGNELAFTSARSARAEGDA